MDRYLGDDYGDGNDPEKEQSRLQQLHLEIENRKRKLDGAHKPRDGKKKGNKIREKGGEHTKTEDGAKGDLTNISEKAEQRSEIRQQNGDTQGGADETMSGEEELPLHEGTRKRKKEKNSKSKDSKSKCKSETQKRRESRKSRNPEDESAGREKKKEQRGTVEEDKTENQSKKEDREQKPERSRSDATKGALSEDIETQECPEYREPSGADLNVPVGYTVIGGHKKEGQVKQVQRVLPEWLAKPTVIDADLSGDLLPVDQLICLEEHLVVKLTGQSMTHFFPVQSAVIPIILSGHKNGYQPRDLCVSAPTGSGKTLAYVLPIVQSLMGRIVCHLRVLVLLPTKDLANQVKQVFDLFTQGTCLKVGLASGTKSFAKEQEMIVGQR